MLNEIFTETVPVILHEDDLNAMCFSMENRSPFLDRDLFDLASSIPTEYLIRDGRAKAILRDAMRGIVPNIVLDERKRLDLMLQSRICSILKTQILLVIF